MKENSKDLTKATITYADDFADIGYVESVIEDWYNGRKLFELKTSGSTGKPKTIELPRELLIWSAESTKTALNLQSPQKILCCLPVRKTGGFMQLIRALHHGWGIHFTRPTSDPLNSADISEITLTSLTPMQLRNSENLEQLTGIDNILLGGAAVNEDLEKALIPLSVNLWETYGMTETASHIALRKLGRDLAFKPLPGVTLSINDENLTISIPLLKIKLETNDSVRLLNVGSFELLGRSDFAINSGGIKIHPNEVESKIRSILKNKKIGNPFYVTSVPDKVLGEMVVLIIKKPVRLEKAELLDVLKNKLDKYESPKNLYLVDDIEITDTDKIIRKPIDAYDELF